MKPTVIALATIAAFLQRVFAEDYKPAPELTEVPGVPKGEVLKFTLSDSKIFPGTTRNVTVYIPKQYDPAKPACVWVNQDGMQHKASTVFDNLIAKGEMPVTIYIAASPGVLKALDGKAALDRFNRSFEYDGLGDAYARFVLSELLPFVEQQKTGDGRAIVLSKDGNDRCIGGSSSGAVCAFIAAWEKPTEFRRVFSTIGTYVGLRGADGLAMLVRKYEPKGLRVFLQDGDRDQNIYGGDWWMANQTMERALAFAGYEVNHAWGTEGHNSKQGDAIFPDAVRWIWKDWPAAPKVGDSKNTMLNEIILPSEAWQLVGEGYNQASGIIANSTGEVFFHAFGQTNTGTLAYAPGTAEARFGNRFSKDTFKVVGNAAPEKIKPFWTPAVFGPEDRLFSIASTLSEWGKDGERSEILNFIQVAGGKSMYQQAFSNIIALTSGAMYATQLAPQGKEYGLVWYVPPVPRQPQLPPAQDGLFRIRTSPRIQPVKVVESGVKLPGGIATSPDQTLLYVSDTKSHWIYSYQIQPDGTLAHGQRYFHIHRPDDADDSGAEGLAVDRDGRLYVATRMGVQVCDQAGRVNCIIPTPNGEVSNVAFGGPQFDTLYATCGDKVFRRKVKTKGAPSFLLPLKPAGPRL